MECPISVAMIQLRDGFRAFTAGGGQMLGTGLMGTENAWDVHQTATPPLVLTGRSPAPQSFQTCFALGCRSNMARGFDRSYFCAMPSEN